MNRGAVFLTCMHCILEELCDCAIVSDVQFEDFDMGY